MKYWRTMLCAVALALAGLAVWAADSWKTIAATGRPAKPPLKEITLNESPATPTPEPPLPAAPDLAPTVAPTADKAPVSSTLLIPLPEVDQTSAVTPPKIEVVLQENEVSPPMPAKPQVTIELPGSEPKASLPPPFVVGPPAKPALEGLPTIPEPPRLPMPTVPPPPELSPPTLPATKNAPRSEAAPSKLAPGNLETHLPSPSPDPFLKTGTTAPAEPLRTAAVKTMTHPLRLSVRTGTGTPRFEIRDGDHLLLKVTSEKMEMHAAHSATAPLPGLCATGKVKVHGSGLDGTCDQLLVVSESGEVVLKGNVRLTCYRAGSSSEIMAEQMKFQLLRGDAAVKPRVHSTTVPSARN